MEPSLGVIGEKYGINSPEGTGVLGTLYIVGAILATFSFGIISPVGLTFGLHPLSLAVACGLGSGSMMATASASLSKCCTRDVWSDPRLCATSNMLAAVQECMHLSFLPFPRQLHL